VNVLQAVILTDKEKMLLTPTYHVYEMYAVHQDAILLPCSVECDAAGIEGDKVPAASASASIDKEGKVHVTLCNLDPGKETEVAFALRGLTPKWVTGRILTADKMQAHNTFENPDMVKPAEFKGASVEPGGLKVKLPAKSVVVLEIG